MKFCYVDESGLRDEDPCFIGVGIVGDGQRIHRTRDAFQDIFSTIGGMFEENLKELKGAKLLMGRDRWRNIAPEERKDICEGFCHSICERKHSLVLTAIDKERYHGTVTDIPQPLRKDVWVAGMVHIALQLQKAHQRQKNNKGKTLLFIDDNKRFADHLAEILYAPPSWADSYYGRGKKQDMLDQIVDSAFAVKSHHAGLVQVADLFALVFRRFTELTDYNSLCRWASDNQKMMNLFSRQAIPMVWDFGEANILNDVVGGWPTCLGYSLPLEIDRQNPNLGRYSTTRRVARTLYIGSAPTLKAANKGLDEQRLKLGCVQPGETMAVFTDALKKLSNRATFLFEDGSHYWFSTSPSLNRLAEDEAERLKDKEDLVFAEIQKRLETNLAGNSGAFSKYHLCPATSHDVVDEIGTRLVVIGPEKLHQRKEESEALKFAKEVVEKRGNTPRQYVNTLVFLAADMQRFDDLAQAVRLYLGWKRIGEMDEDELDLTNAAKRQIAAKMKEFDGAIASRVTETWCWLLTPSKELKSPAVTWHEARLQGSGTLASRASSKLESDAVLLDRIAPSVLRHEIDRVPLWRGDHVQVRQIVEDFAKHLYLPRITKTGVLIDAICESIQLTSWELDGFAYADSYDEDKARYRGLKVGMPLTLGGSDASLIVKPEVAKKQFAAESAERTTTSIDGGISGTFGGIEESGRGAESGAAGSGTGSSAPAQPSEFHGSITLGPTKLTPQVAAIAEEVVQHLASKLGVEVEITIDLHAKLPAGFDPGTVRTVTANCIALKFEDHGFETPSEG